MPVLRPGRRIKPELYAAIIEHIRTSRVLPTRSPRLMEIAARYLEDKDDWNAEEKCKRSIKHILSILSKAKVIKWDKDINNWLMVEGQEGRHE